mmetsp:Transcript_87416/g.282402  ORF Transcript_87416/g.282402 Transcript_87416/m.282402 type:complete len:81 (+) Transcript_87416:304-546(+)
MRSAVFSGLDDLCDSEGRARTSAMLANMLAPLATGGSVVSPSGIAAPFCPFPSLLTDLHQSVKLDQVAQVKFLELGLNEL